MFSSYSGFTLKEILGNCQSSRHKIFKKYQAKRSENKDISKNQFEDILQVDHDNSSSSCLIVKLNDCHDARVETESPEHFVPNEESNDISVKRENQKISKMFPKNFMDITDSAESHRKPVKECSGEIFEIIDLSSKIQKSSCPPRSFQKTEKCPRKKSVSIIELYTE
jgi:hypothetical protein